MSRIVVGIVGRRIEIMASVIAVCDLPYSPLSGTTRKISSTYARFRGGEFDYGQGILWALIVMGMHGGKKVA